MNDLFRLDGKVALVTGAAAGIGAAIAEALAEYGADVACHGNTRPADATAARIEAKNRKAAALSGNLADRATPARLVGEVLERFGRIDIVVNNAGGTMPRPMLDTSPGYLERAFHFNVTSAFNLSQLAARQMVDTVGHGAIVNISSRSATMTQTAFAALAAP